MCLHWLLNCRQAVKDYSIINAHVSISRLQLPSKFMNQDGQIAIAFLKLKISPTGTIRSAGSLVTRRRRYSSGRFRLRTR